MSRLKNMEGRFEIIVPTTPPDPQTLQWYRARDSLLGRNDKWQGLERAIALAADCTHPDAVWLTEIAHGRVPRSFQEMQYWLIENDSTETMDPRAFVFTYLVSGTIPGDHSLVDGIFYEKLQKIAKNGFAFAQALCAEIHMQGLDDIEIEDYAFQMAYQGSLQDERDAWILLSQCYNNGWGTNTNEQLGFACLRRAAELGHVPAQSFYGEGFVIDEPEHFLWKGKAASGAERTRSFQQDFIVNVQWPMNEYSRLPTTQIGKVIFQIGAILRNCNSEIEQVVNTYRFRFCGATKRKEIISNLKYAVKLHDTWCRLTRTTVDVWCCIALRYQVSRDIRRLIGEIIWASRRDALYELDASDETIVYRQGTRRSARNVRNRNSKKRQRK